MGKKNPINTLSTGQPSTLKGYREAASDCWGPGSPQVAFIDGLINNSKMGENEEVVVNERSFVWMLSLIREVDTNEKK